MTNLSSKTNEYKPAPIPENEKERLEALYSFQILDSKPNPSFDTITKMTSKLLNTTHSLVSLVDRNRIWHAAMHGTDFRELPRDTALCAHAILQDNPFIILNTVEHPIFCNNPFVKGEPHIRFYAGMPIVTENNIKLGTLCAIGDKPRDEFTEDDEYIIRSLAQMTTDVINLHLAQIRVSELRK